MHSSPDLLQIRFLYYLQESIYMGMGIYERDSENAEEKLKIGANLLSKSPNTPTTLRELRNSLDLDKATIPKKK
ncbi:13323_t:CDS:2 [Acaulospora morrowiae]|uniref:13323_t:CDS:1 n=1 Tax=Acaulospora morrowiae TaxID=94023 RepID=A0A9N9A098_9GLOM|nr:13323_t:CDS:2 [Acaulospora morrowiae]